MIFITWRCNKCNRIGYINSSKDEKCPCGGKIVKISADIGDDQREQGEIIRSIVFGQRYARPSK